MFFDVWPNYLDRINGHIYSTSELLAFLSTSAMYIKLFEEDFISDFLYFVYSFANAFDMAKD